MDYKKRYSDALERARYYHSKDYILINSAIENIFPELAESEDERIRKAIISGMVALKNNQNIKTFAAIPINDCIAWLEKQGEQTHVEIGQSGVTKTSDQELEPKFHKGDWIISNDKKSTYQVIEVKRGVYVIRDNADNHEYHIDIEGCEKSGRLWTIQDAKDGDVLVCPSDLGDRLVVFIFKQLVNNASEIDCHCCIDANGIFDPCLNDCCYVGDVSRDDYVPATKKQRDLLFQKMTQAGYEWDSKNKELKKIESKELDADKVIAWLVANICDFDYYVKLFKKDFGL